MYVLKCQYSRGRDMALVVGRRHLTVENRAICQASRRKMCGSQCGPGTLWISLVSTL